MIRCKPIKAAKKCPNTTNVVAGILLICYFRIQKIAVPLQRQSEQIVIEIFERLAKSQISKEIRHER